MFRCVFIQWMIYVSMVLIFYSYYHATGGLKKSISNQYVFNIIESPNQVLSLFHHEQKAIILAKEMSYNLRKKHEYLTTFLNSQAVRSSSSQNNSTTDSSFNNRKYAEHPLDSFALIKRTIIGMVNISKQLNFLNSEANHQMSFFRNVSKNFPKLEDLAGAVRCLLILYDTYNFNLKASVSGHIKSDENFNHKFRGLESRSKEHLEPSDLLEMAKVAKSFKWVDLVIKLTSALINLDQTSLADKTNGEKLRNISILTNNNLLQKYHMTMGENFRILPFLVDDKGDKLKQQPNFVKEVRKYTLLNDMGTDSHFRAVCGGRDTGTAVPQIGQMTCGYLHHWMSYLKLGPFKLEVASIEPYIVIFHDIFDQIEQDWLIEYSAPLVSNIRNEQQSINAGKQRHQYRYGKVSRYVQKTVQVWINDMQYDSADTASLFDRVDRNFTYTIKNKLLFKLAKKIELATTLNATAKWSSTQFQTTNYGIGGTCELHMDAAGFLEGLQTGLSRDKYSGDIFGTFMGWMDDDLQGGATAFVSSNSMTTVKPVKGSAAFWFGLDRKGYRDQRLSHGGCPVLSGSKWILNKWMYSFDQFARYPCSLNPYAYGFNFKGFY